MFDVKVQIDRREMKGIWFVNVFSSVVLNENCVQMVRIEMHFLSAKLWNFSSCTTLLKKIFLHLFISWAQSSSKNTSAKHTFYTVSKIEMQYSSTQVNRKNDFQRISDGFFSPFSFAHLHKLTTH